MYQPDSVHPTVAGSGIIAQKVSEMLLMQKPEVKFENGKVTAPDGFDFQWYIDGIPVTSENGGTLKVMDVTKSGKYKVSVKLNADNETRVVSKELYLQGTYINSGNLYNIKVYPNPAFNIINIKTDNKEYITSYSITDLSGKQLLHGQIQYGYGEINIEKLSAGIYTLVIGNNHLNFIKKISPN